MNGCVRVAGCGWVDRCADSVHNEVVLAGGLQLGGWSGQGCDGGMRGT